MGARKILIIDDEADFCDLVKKNLELSGEFEVIAANDAKQGLAAAKKNKPALIILDIMMPGMDGLGVLQELKVNMKTALIPVIMLTAKGDEVSIARAGSLYDEEYIIKPVEFSELKIKIEAALKRTSGIF